MEAACILCFLEVRPPYVCRPLRTCYEQAQPYHGVLVIFAVMAWFPVKTPQPPASLVLQMNILPSAGLIISLFIDRFPRVRQFSVCQERHAGGLEIQARSFRRDTAPALGRAKETVSSRSGRWQQCLQSLENLCGFEAEIVSKNNVLCALCLAKLKAYLHGQFHCEISKNFDSQHRVPQGVMVPQMLPVSPWTHHRTSWAARRQQNYGVALQNIRSSVWPATLPCILFTHWKRPPPTLTLLPSFAALC